MDQLRALRVFAQVIAEGSFAGAARVLDLAPAVVTRAVSDLEDHLGARLLNRTTRKLALTEVGKDYLERARRVLAELDDADALASAANIWEAVRQTLRTMWVSRSHTTPTLGAPYCAPAWEHHIAGQENARARTTNATPAVCRAPSLPTSTSEMQRALLTALP